MTDPIRAAILAVVDERQCVHREDLIAEAADRSGQPREIAYGTLGQMLCRELEMDGRGMVRRRERR